MKANPSGQPLSMPSKLDAMMRVKTVTVHKAGEGIRCTVLELGRSSCGKSNNNCET